MEAPQMRGVEEPLLPEPRAVEGGATQSEGAIETQEARYPRLHKTAGLRALDVWAEISRMSTGRTLSEATTGNNHPSEVGHRNTCLPQVVHSGTSDQPKVSTTSRQAEMLTCSQARACKAR